MTMGMMGCLGVWVTDALEPEETYFEMRYAVDGTYYFSVVPISPLLVIVDWGDNIIKSYSTVEGVGYNITRYCDSSNPVKIYTPDNILEFETTNVDFVGDIETLTNIDTFSVTDFTGDEFTIPNDLTHLRLLVFNGDNLTTFTLGTGNTALLALSCSNSPNLSSVTLPNDLTNTQTIQFIDCGLSEASVNAILITADANYSNIQNIDLSGGTSASPTGAGAVAAASLDGKGVNVSTN